MRKARWGFLLSVTLLIAGCSWKSDCLKTPAWLPGDERYCDIPPVAHPAYRIPLHYYHAFTVPKKFFDDLPSEPREDTINVLALGDSWFAYPKPEFSIDMVNPPSNVLTNLSHLSHPTVNILSLSNGGELVTNIAGLAVQEPAESVQSIQTRYSIPWITARVLRRMKDPQLGKNNKFDYILISGGGNDFYPSRIRTILGNERCTSPKDAMKCINEKELDGVIERLRKAYVALIAIIRSEQDGKHPFKIVTHTYDHIYPMPAGATFLGGFTESTSIADYGWFYPVLEEYGIIDREQQRTITNYFLTKFKNMLLTLSENQEYKEHFHVVDTQGVLERAHEQAVHDGRSMSKEFPVTDYWLNEIHPTAKGFRCISETIHKEMRDDMRARNIPFQEDLDGTYECIEKRKTLFQRLISALRSVSPF